MSEKKPKVLKEVVTDPPQGPRWWRWLVTHGEGVAILLTLIGVMLWVTWSLSKYDSRLGNLENVVNGTGGLTEQVGKLGESVKRIETTAETLEKYFLPQVLELLKPKAAALLGTSDIEIFNVAHNEVTTDARFSVPYKNPLQNLSPQKQFFMTYTFEGIKDGFFFVRVQVEEEEGKVVQTLYDRRVQVGLPTEVGKPDETCFKLVDNATQAELPPVCIEVVLLERVGPNNLIFASAVKMEGTS